MSFTSSEWKGAWEPMTGLIWSGARGQAQAVNFDWQFSPNHVIGIRGRAILPKKRARELLREVEDPGTGRKNKQKAKCLETSA